jgi:hypothetical protein
MLPLLISVTVDPAGRAPSLNAGVAVEFELIATPELMVTVMSKGPAGDPMAVNRL